MRFSARLHLHQGRLFRIRPKAIELGLQMPTPLGPIHKAKKNLEFFRQRPLWTIKLWAKVLSCNKHALRGEDAHRLLLLLDP